MTYTAETFWDEEWQAYTRVQKLKESGIAAIIIERGNYNTMRPFLVAIPKFTKVQTPVVVKLCPECGPPASEMYLDGGIWVCHCGYEEG